MVSDKKILKVFVSKIYFTSYDLDINGLEPFKQLLKRTIPAKFGQIPASSWEILSLEDFVDDGHQTITIAHIAPLD